MPLGADLSGHLDIGGPVGALLGALGTASGGLGTIVPPLDPAARDSAAGAASGISLDGLGTALTRVSGAVTPLLQRIPGVDGALPGIESAIALLEQGAAPDLVQRITDLVEGLDATLEAERGGTLSQVLRVLEIVKSAPEAGLLRDLASQVERLLGGQPLSETAFAGFAEIVPSISGAAAAFGGMTRLDAALEEAERLSVLAAAQLDRATLNGIEAEIAARLGEGPGSLAAFIAALDLGEAAAVATAARELETISARLGVLASTFRDGMAFGEATLVHLDLAGFRQAIEAIRAEVRGVDLAPLERTLAAVAGRLSGVVSLDLGAAPIRSLEQLLAEIEGQVEAFAAGIATIDVAALLGPLGEGLARVTALPGQLAGTLQQAADAIGDGLDAVRDGVRALPLDDVSGQLRGNSPARSRRRSRSWWGSSAGSKTRSAPRPLRRRVSCATPKTGSTGSRMRSTPPSAKPGMRCETADIDGIASEIEANLRGFLDIVAQAEWRRSLPPLQAGSAAPRRSSKTCRSISCPNSMEQDVVDAIRPVKQVDADATRSQIEVTLEIEGGKFNLRPTIEAAIADFKTQLDALVAQIRALDPEQLARPLQQPIDAFGTTVQGLSLDVELAPLREALDAAKAAVAQLDPAALLAPVEGVFDESARRHRPLLAGAAHRAARRAARSGRERLIGMIGLRTWRDRLDGSPPRRRR